MLKNKYIFLIIIVFVFCLYFVEPLRNYATILSLLLGIFLRYTDKFYVPEKLNDYRKTILNASIVFFGFSLNINAVIEVGSKGVILSLVSLIVVIVCGYLLLKLINYDKVTGELTIYGTAICGGSAIAATSSVLKASSKQIAMAMATVFLLNTVALVIFPILGHLLNLTQYQFGVWSALSIHDVSSVVGAASAYGEEALATATILKLTRTLWIIPIAIVLSKKNNSKKKALFPMFILYFLIASVITTLFPYEQIQNLSTLGKTFLSVALFLVGYGIHIKDLKELGVKGITFGLILWMISIITGLTLALM